MQPADRVERVGLSGCVASLLVQVQGEPVVFQRQSGLALPVEHPGQVLVGTGLADRVIYLAEQVQGSREVGMSVVVAACPRIGVSQSAAAASLGGLVWKALGRGDRRALGGDPVMPVAEELEEVDHGPGKLPGLGVEAGIGRQREGREQRLVLGSEPVQGLSVAAEALWSYAVRVRRQVDLVPCGVEQHVSGVGGVQVVVEDAAGGRTTL